MKWTYVHNDRIYKVHRNLEIRKQITTSCSGTKPFYKLWVKGFDIRRSDTIFYAFLFIWPPSRTASIGRKFALRQRAPKVDPSCLASSIQLFNFLQISTNLCALPVHDITCTLSPVLSQSIVTSEWHLHSPVHSRVNTCINVCTLLTHVLSQKVLSLTKLKGMNRNYMQQIISVMLKSY